MLGRLVKLLTVQRCLAVSNAIPRCPHWGGGGGGRGGKEKEKKGGGGKGGKSLGGSNVGIVLRPVGDGAVVSPGKEGKKEE